MTALRRRLIEDMQVRNYSPRTVEAYVSAVAKLATHFKRSPDQLTSEDLRAFQVSLNTSQWRDGRVRPSERKRRVIASPFGVRAQGVQSQHSASSNQGAASKSA